MSRVITSVFGVALAIYWTSSGIVSECRDCRTTGVAESELLVGCGSGHDQIRKPGDRTTDTREQSV